MRYVTVGTAAMRGAFSGLVALLLLTTGHAADWKEELSQPLVKTVGSKMVLEDFELCSGATQEDGSEQASIQVRTRSEAPKDGFISRDYFVAITSILKVEILEQFEDIDCKTLQSPIGTPDLQINLVMTEEGLQVEVANTGTGQKTRNTVQWRELFAE